MLPFLSGPSLETVVRLVRLIQGEVAVHLRHPGNNKVLEGAVILELVARERVSLASLLWL